MDAVRNRLHQLRQRLLAANLRSRSLRLTRATRSGCFDLSRLGELNGKALDRVVTAMGRTDETKIPLLAAKGGADEAGDAAEDLRRLSNAARRTWQEVGEDELRLGWPLLEGKFDDTWIRAPLLLFPVELVRTRRGKLMWQLTVQGRPDVNEVMTQALYRLAGVRLDLQRLLELDDDQILKPDDGTWAALESWLQEGGLEVADPVAILPALTALDNRPRELRSDYPDGRAELHHAMLVGRFPQSSSNVLSEYNELDGRLELLSAGPAAELLAIDLDAPLPEAPKPPEDEAETASPADGLTGEEDARVLPSDASQEAVIRALDQLDGRGLVVRGPPGTGKSQLIANLVGQAIHRNERVLVVCQKRAALDVVAERMGSLGLQEPLALVHDINKDRHAFTAELASSLERAFDPEHETVLSDVVRAEKRALATAEANKKRFATRLGAADAAYRRMMAPGPGGRPLAELFERALEDDGRDLPDLSAVAGDVVEDTVITTLPDIETLAPGSRQFASPHPLSVRTDWAGLDGPALDTLKSNLEKLRDALQRCGGEDRATMTPAVADGHRDLWTETSSVLDLFESRDTAAHDRFAVFWTFTDAGKSDSAFESLVSTLERAAGELESVPAALYLAETDTVIEWLAQLNELNDVRSRWWRFLLPRFWRLRKVPAAIIERCALAGTMVPEKVHEDLIRLCERTLEWHNLIREIGSLLDEAPFFELACTGQTSELEDAVEAVRGQRSQVDQILTLHRSLRGHDGAYAELPDFAAEGSYDHLPLLGAALADRREAENLARAEQIADSVAKRVRSSWVDGLVADARKGEPEVAGLDRVLAAWGEAEAAAGLDHRQRSVPVWAREFLRFYRPEPEADGTDGQTIDSFDAGRLADDLQLALERAWRRIALGNTPPDEAEAALVDETQRAGLSEAYNSMVESTAPAVLARFNQRLRRAAGTGDAISREMRKCLKDAGKKRYRLSIRQFVQKYWDNCLGLLRPVWLCSPESVAALFPLQTGLFDRVVMDEASQCPVESALPALIRGNRVVVAGDEKQMPPSHFFASRDEDEWDDEDDSALLSAQSILDVSRVTYPGTMLRFHYRSRFEELITFSNHAFYGGGLVTAPAAHVDKAPFEGMQFENVGGLWQSQTNQTEAERVVDAVLDTLRARLSDDTPPTVGVVTFNQKQRQLVEDLLDERALEDEEARDLLGADRERQATETLFVKNIENVQGDERDIIIFSVGYGPEEPGGRVHARFGPVGVEGGENRLNVAVTRAKRGVRVVTSFEPNQLNTSKTKHVGPKLFSAYLDYARNAAGGLTSEVERVLAEVAVLGGETEASAARRLHTPVGSKVRDALATRLEACGLQVARNFGIGPFRLDIAVRDPSRGGEDWHCGVDCTRFLATGDAVQRDVSEHFFWQRAGWRVFRVSPAMWLEKRDEVVASVLAAVK